MRIKFICAATALSILVPFAGACEAREILRYKCNKQHCLGDILRPSLQLKAGDDDIPPVATFLPVDPELDSPNAEKTENSDKYIDEKRSMQFGIVEYTFVPKNNAMNMELGKKFKKEVKKDINILAPDSEVKKNGLISLKVLELNTIKLAKNRDNIGKYKEKMKYDVHTDSRYFPENIDYDKQAAEHAALRAHNKALQEKSILLNEKWDEESLNNEVLAEAPLYGKRMVLEYVMETNPKMMNCINSQGIKRTIYSSNAAKQGLTLGSPMYKKNLSGIDMGIPLVIYDLVNEVTNYAYGGENPFKRREMLDLASKSYEDLVKIIDDPNIKKAMAMPAEQVKLIGAQQKKTQAGSKDNSGGSTAAGGVAADGAAESAEGHHHHEEEDPGPAPAMNSGSMTYP